MEKIQSLEVLNDHYKKNLSALQALRDELLGNRVEIIFHPNGGSACRNRVVYMRQSYGELPKPYRPGYDFKGWYRNYDNVTVKGEEFFADPVHDFDYVNVTVHTLHLYAKWELAWIRVDLDAQGGVVEPDVISVRYLKTFRDATQGPGYPTGLPTPTHIDNKFVHWSSDKPPAGGHGTNVYNNDTRMYNTEPMTLYANWSEVVFWLTYDVNGGSGKLDKLSGVTKEIRNLVDLNTARQHMSRPGFTLMGFSFIRNNTQAVTSVQFDHNDLIVYAIWKRDSYEIEYYSQNSSTRPMPTINQNPNYSPYNPQRVLLDWIDYLNFADDFKNQPEVKRWTSISSKNSSGDVVYEDSFIAKLMPYDGDLVYNYGIRKDDKIRIRPATDTEINTVENKTVVSVVLVSNPLSNRVLNHGDTITTDGFRLSAKFSNGQTMPNLTGRSIRVYPSMAKYIRPATASASANNSYVIASFGYNDLMYGVKQPITVEKIASYMTVVAKPSKMIYRNGETMNPAGLKLSVVYADGADTEVLAWTSGSDCPLSCSMKEGVDAAGIPSMSSTTVTKKDDTMYVYFNYKNQGSISAAVKLDVRWATAPVLRVSATSSVTKRSFEPDEDTILDPGPRGLDLVVKKVYENETPGTYTNNEVVVHDYTFTPRSVSEESITRTLNDNVYMGEVSINVLYSDTDSGSVISATFPISIYQYYGISALELPSGTTSWNLKVEYKERSVKAYSSAMSAFTLIGRYNRPNETTPVTIRASECEASPSTLYPTTKAVTLKYDNAAITVSVNVSLDSACYVGVIKLFKDDVLSQDRKKRCDELSVDAWPVVMQQTSGGDYSYSYTGDKYIMYEIDEDGTTKTIMKRSEYDKHDISIKEYEKLHPYSSLFHISVLYTNPEVVYQLNNHVLKRKSCADDNSMVRSIDFRWLNSVRCIRYFGAYQRKMEFCFIGNQNSQISEIGYTAFLSCTSMKKGIILPTDHSGIYNDSYWSANKLLLPARLHSIGYKAFMCCTKITNLVPYEKTLDPVNCILCCTISTMGNYAFRDCTSLSDVNSRIFGRVPSSTKYDGNPYLSQLNTGCFANCKKLTGISLREVRIIGPSAFYKCEKLATVSLNKKDQKVGNINVGYKLTRIDGKAFAKTKITGTSKISNFDKSITKEVNKTAFDK